MTGVYDRSYDSAGADGIPPQPGAVDRGPSQAVCMDQRIDHADEVLGLVNPPARRWAYAVEGCSPDVLVSSLLAWKRSARYGHSSALECVCDGLHLPSPYIAAGIAGHSPVAPW